MANSLLTTQIIVREALVQLENELVAAKLVNRRYEKNYSKAKDGDTIRVRRPIRYNVRTGATMVPQDTEEGNISVKVDKQRGVDLQFSSVDMTLTIEEFSERYLKAGMKELAQYIDADILALYYKVPNWVGATTETVDSYSDYTRGPERLDQLAVPAADRVGILHTTDHWATVRSLSGIYVEKRAESAIKNAEIGMLADTATYKSQNIAIHTTGTWSGSPVCNTSTAPTTYAAVKGTTPMQQTLAVTGAATGVTGYAKAGDVITIVGVNDINPRNYANLGRLKQFTVLADADSDGGGAVSLTISPAIITSGPYRNCVISSAGSGKALVPFGAAAATNRANLVMHKDALGLVMVPMELPAGAVNPARETYKDISARLIPVYDGTNDYNQWRLDVLYGVEAYYPEMATRLCGTSGS